MLLASEGGKNCLHWSKDNGEEPTEDSLTIASNTYTLPEIKQGGGVKRKKRMKGIEITSGEDVVNETNPDIPIAKRTRLKTKS